MVPLVDVGIAAVSLIAMTLPMIVICLAIWLESGRPLFFRQERLGKDGQLFQLYKFRKFHPDAGTAGLGLTLKDDARLTSVGRVLERTKLDELPQLWNVLAGDMSLVGPRPETPRFSACYGSKYRGVLDYKPGILGPSQTLFRNESALYRPGCDPERFYREFVFPAKAQLDLDYYRKRTLFRDLGWILRGVLAVLGFSGSAQPNLQTVEAVDIGLGETANWPSAETVAPTQRKLSEFEGTPHAL